MTPRDVRDMFLLSAFWGVSFLMIKWAGHAFPPFWIALLRSVFGGAVLLLTLGVQRQSLPARQHWPLLAGIAFFSNALPWLCFAFGEQTVSSNIAAILNATTPLFTLLIAAGLGYRGLDDTRLHWRMVLGVLIGLLGVALTVLGGMSGGQASVAGVGVILVAALSYGVGSTIAKRNVTGLTPLSIAASQMIFSSLWLLPFALLGPHPANVTVQALGAVAVLGVFGSGLAYLVFYGLLARVSATQVNAVTYVLPIWGLFWGALAGEHVALTSILGVLVVLSGLLLLNLPPRTAPSVR